MPRFLFNGTYRYDGIDKEEWLARLVIGRSIDRCYPGRIPD